MDRIRQYCRTTGFSQAAIIRKSAIELDRASGAKVECGSSLGKVVKTTVFMTNLQEFATMNEVYGGVFASDPPARSTIQVAALPGGASVEIEAMAWIEAG